jgi:uncharacterized lipoprotein YehR (DUF1307 family)|tara:strand:+ start:306 stop:548 length:243 start_codon:yes stop_codon:yes gene_type:complete
MKNYFKEGTNLTITYFKEDDIIIKRISDDDIVIYEQIMVKSPMSEFAYDKMFYNELYEKETNIASGFTECKREDGKCVIQ